MRVLMLSKACIVGIYQRKLEEMAAAAPDLDLLVVVPPYWKNERGITPLEKAYTGGYRLEVVPMALNGQFHLHFYPQLRRSIRKFRPDVVHIDEEPYNLATYHANRLSRRAKAKTLWFSWQNLKRTYPPPFSWMEAYNLHHIDYAITGSQTASQVWREKGYAGPLAVIPQFGVDPDIFTAPTRPRLDNDVHIVYLGRLVPEKGVDLLIRALDSLDGNWHVTIQGNGPEQTHLQAICARLGLEKRVSFRAAIPSVDMPKCYQNVDILVLPSRTQVNWTEQFGRVLIEAMASGVAVIGAETGEIPYVIGDAGLTFPENDVHALRRALARVIHTPALRAALAQKGRQRVLEHYTQRHIAQATLQVYEEMLS